MPVLQITCLRKQYRGGTLANDGISLALEPGEVYGLLGPNGAGKTTLVRQVLGLLKPTSGEILVEGVDVVANPAYSRSRIGFLPQGQFDLQSLRVGELVESVARLRGLSAVESRRRSDALIKKLELGEFCSTSMHSASGGVRRLAGFAAAVVGDTRLLVLDEPTNDVDPIRRQLLWDTIAELGHAGRTVLLVTHNLAEAERVIDRLAIIDGGRILREGSPASLRSVVSDKLRLELTLAREVPIHPALLIDPRGPGLYLFEQSNLPCVSTWLSGLREDGSLLDFRIGPPNLDDIYAAAVGPARELEAVR
jgi:ABC-2 type transport system ATP-binding protein